MTDRNEVVLEGTIEKIESRQTTTGKTVWNLVIATKGRGKYPDRHKVVAWEAGESLSEDSKDARALVKGRMQTRSWEGKNGKQYVTEVQAESITVLDAGGGGGSEPTGQEDYPF